MSDQQLFHLINATLHFPWLDSFFLFITFLGLIKWVFIFPWLWLMIKGQKRDRQIGIVLVVLLVGTDLLCAKFLKPAFAHLRPFDQWEHVRLLVDPTFHLSQYSFPSSHAANIFAAMSFLFLCYRKWAWRVLFVLAAILVGYSRIYIGVHSPLDVGAGAALGIILGTLAYYCWKKKKWAFVGLGLAVLLLWIKIFNPLCRHCEGLKGPRQSKNEYFGPRLPRRAGHTPTAPRNDTHNTQDTYDAHNTHDAHETNEKKEINNLQQQIESHLKISNPSKRTLPIPPPLEKTPQKNTKTADPLSRAIEKIKEEEPGRLEGIEQRKKLPLGVILHDDVNITEFQTGGKTLYKMRSGDFAKLYLPKAPSGKIQIHPGVDVYLAATSRAIEITGTRFPDQAGWVDPDKIHIFEPDQAIEFTENTTPLTLGNTPDFSTVQFYERAFKNPDPVVHRIIGPRLIDLFSLHEDYTSSWGALYRDPDSKIRALALLTLKKRGVGNSRPIIEDLITRLSELTQTRAQGEREIEILTIINILKESNNPRVFPAFASFKEAWAQTQPETILDALPH